MRKRKIGRVVLSLLAGSVFSCSGCSQIAEKIRPDSVRVGVVARQIKGKYRRFKVRENPCFYRIQGNKKLNDEIDFYARLDYNHGSIDASHDFLDGKVSGHFESLGLGVNYFPFDSRYVGFDLGVEGFYADYGMSGGKFRFRDKTPDSLFGYGFNTGVVGEIPLDKKRRFFISWGAGYNFTDSFVKKANADFDGWYGFLGVGINLGGD